MQMRQTRSARATERPALPAPMFCVICGAAAVSKFAMNWFT